MKKLLALIAGALIAGGTAYGDKPFNLSLTPDIAVHNRSETIKGLTLSIWGENQQTSLAVGVVNGSIGPSTGASLGILNYADTYKGLQWAFVNYTEGDFSGWQGGPFFGLLSSVLNYTGGKMTGLQFGLVNYAGQLSGLQLGIVNYAERENTGVQIGLVNIMPENKWFDNLPDELAPAMVLVNWHF